MKTAPKIIAGIVGTLIAAVAIFYFGWLSPPDADAVCDNVERVTAAELEKKANTKRKRAKTALGSVRKNCERAATTTPKFGRAVWVKRLKCMRDADDMSALDACDEIKTL